MIRKIRWDALNAIGPQWPRAPWTRFSAMDVGQCEAVPEESWVRMLYGWRP